MRTRRMTRLVAVVLTAAFLLASLPAVGVALDVAPGAPTISTPGNLLSRDGNVAIAGVVDAATTELKIVTPSMVMTMAVTPGGPFTANVTVPVARTASAITVTPVNGSVEGASAVLSVYNLGPVTPLASFVLVDKSDYTLYYVRFGIVRFVAPVAIGMSGARTPIGTWTLGNAQWMNPRTSWGRLRIPLMRSVVRRVKVRVRVRGGWRRKWVRRTVLVKTSYYIHGTNDPDSIGTMASHGCVRMYNADVIAFRNLAGRSRVVIRN